MLYVEFSDNRIHRNLLVEELGLQHFYYQMSKYFSKSKIQRSKTPPSSESEDDDILHLISHQKHRKKEPLMYEKPTEEEDPLEREILQQRDDSDDSFMILQQKQPKKSGYFPQTQSIEDEIIMEMRSSPEPFVEKHKDTNKTSSIPSIFEVDDDISILSPSISKTDRKDSLDFFTQQSDSGDGIQCLETRIAL